MSTAPDEWTFHVDHLVKHFGTVAANDGITLQVEPGEVYGLLGPNGAGKSTLVKQTIGLLKPTSGRITLGRWDLVENPDAARQLCSYLPQAQMPIDSFRLREAIELAGRIRGAEIGRVRRRTDELIEALELGEWSRTLGARLSGGVKRLVGFCMAAISPRRTWSSSTSRPTTSTPCAAGCSGTRSGPSAAHGCSVLLVTHNVLEAEKAVDRLALIASGRLVAEGTPSSLKEADRAQLRLQVMLVPGAETPAQPGWAGPPVRVGNNLVTTIAESDAPPASPGPPASSTPASPRSTRWGEHPRGRLHPARPPTSRSTVSDGDE